MRSAGRGAVQRGAVLAQRGLRRAGAAHRGPGGVPGARGGVVPGSG